MNENNEFFTFSYFDRDDNRKVEYTFNVNGYDDTIFWDAVHARFLDFLSCVYGYNIRDKVSVEMTVREKMTDDEQLDLFGSYGGNDEQS